MKMITFSEKGLNLLEQTMVMLTILILTFVVGMSYSLTQYNILVFFAALTTVLGGTWLLFGQKKSTPLKPYILVWLAAYTISVILSIDPMRSLSQMFLMLVGIFLFLLAYDLISRGWQITWFMKAYILVGVIVIILSLNEAGSWYLRWLSANPGNWFPDISYRLGTANLMPPFLFLSFHMGLPLLIRSKKWSSRILLGVIMFLGMVVLYLTSSRGGWLGMFFGLVVWGVYFLTNARDFIKTTIQKIFAKKILFFAILLVLVIVISLGGYLLYKQAIHPTHVSVLSARSGLWGSAVTAFKENPIFGQGQFTYGSSYLRENSSPPYSVYPHAHGLYHNLIGEMGIVGFLAAVLFMVVYFRKYRRIYQQSKDKIILLSILAFIVSCAVHNVFDAYHTKPAMLWPLAILAGAAITQPSVNTSHQSKLRPWGVLILIPFAWLGIWTITPYYRAVELANQSQWQPAYEMFQQAVKRDPGNALAHQQLALTAAVLAKQDDQAMLDIAITALETTIQYEPSWAFNHANLSALYMANDQPDQAVNSAQNAFKLAPGEPLYTLNLGYILEQTGDEDQAQSAYLQALDLNPSWSSASYWEETPLRVMTQDSWLQEHPSSSATTLEEAEKVLQDNSQVSWAYNQLASVLLDQGELDTARKTLENAGLAYVNSSVDGIETQWLWAEYYAQTGDHIKAFEMGKQAVNHYNSYGIFGPGTFGSLQYAPNLFRLNAMAMEIVPQMINAPVPEIWIEREKLLSEWKD